MWVMKILSSEMSGLNTVYFSQKNQSFGNPVTEEGMTGELEPYVVACSV